jgi:hypothetical protein
MIYTLWTQLRRAKRYREISAQIIPLITHETQRRLDVTLTEAYAKLTAEQSPPEVKQNFKLNMQALIDKSNEVLAKENALRVRQWSTAILEEEERFESGRTP